MYVGFVRRGKRFLVSRSMSRSTRTDDWMKPTGRGQTRGNGGQEMDCGGKCRWMDGWMVGGGGGGECWWRGWDGKGKPCVSMTERRRVGRGWYSGPCHRRNDDKKKKMKKKSIAL